MQSVLGEKYHPMEINIKLIGTICLEGDHVKTLDD